MVAWPSLSGRPIEARIEAALGRLAEEEQVCILFACESGSRAWGFESVDSDYDVRFIYLRRPTWYLRVWPGRDVIECPIDDQLDICGWDLRKALQLLSKSNPPLLEWLHSPTVYQEIRPMVAMLRDLVPVFYSSRACHHHYLHMAEGNHRDYLRGPEVWLKKYLYVLRPILACRWIERGLGVVPMEFATLVEHTVKETSLLAAIRDLLARKKAGEELDRGPRIPVISDFLAAEIARFAGKRIPPERPLGMDCLDQVFVTCLRRIFGERCIPGSVSQD